MSLRTSTTTTVVNEKEKVPPGGGGKVPRLDCGNAKYREEWSPEVHKFMNEHFATLGWDPTVCSDEGTVSKHKMQGRTYKLCKVHGMASDRCNKAMSHEEQKDDKLSAVNQGGDADDVALERAKIDSLSGKQPGVNNAPSSAFEQGLRGEFLVTALSETTLNKGPVVWRPWSSELSTVDSDQYDNLSGNWRRVWLNRATLDKMQGNQVLNLEDASFQVVFFVHGYSSDQSKVFITVPSVEVQCEVPRDILQGDCKQGGWGSESILLSTLRSTTFVDGLSSAGVSMFKKTLAPSMTSSIKQALARSRRRFR